MKHTIQFRDELAGKFDQNGHDEQHDKMDYNLVNANGRYVIKG